MAKTLLITGASGFLGEPLCRIAQSQWQVKGVYHRHPINTDDRNFQALDLTDTPAITDWFQAHRPNAVIHTAALSKPNQCEQDPVLSYAINVIASETLATLCQDYSIPFLFTSTDQVFDGQAAPYDESSLPNPINVYGRHKWIAEQRIREIYPAATICRLPLLYGPPGSYSTCFVQDFLAQIEKGQPLPLFKDEYRTPAYVDDVAAGLLLALGHPGTLLHLGGLERLSRYQFGVKMAAMFGFDAHLIKSCRQAEVTMAAPRPADVSVNSQRAMDLGYSPRGIDDGLKSICQWERNP
jgi:dTDP-4-dehydrorhamnose reductase